MKYLKTFERRYENKYRLGDYLLVDPKNPLNNYSPINNGKPCVVIEEHGRGLDAAKVKFSNGEEYWAWESYIIRRLTSDEIEKFEKDLELNLTAKKYNL
jgi:hypothetical protein